MNRREFLKYSSSAFVVSTLTNTLNANTNIKEELFPSKTLKSELVFSKDKDIFLPKEDFHDFQSIRKKLTLIQRHIGHGNFNIISFDQMLKVAKYAKTVESFTKSEIDFLEKFFYYEPSVHGFFGKRISKNITETINKKEVIKIPHTGHYLFKGEPQETYYKMLDDIGPSLILTSGIRSIVKQTKLFLDKLHLVDGNLSKASRSLAPPAYTYHTIADFDVGKKGFGYKNFTSRFALTQEFAKMKKLNYIDMRYTINNKDGVRYEPWHVKII